MIINSGLYRALWFDNGKKLTLMSYIYIVLGIGCLIYGDTTAAMLALVMAELNRVDKDVRISCICDTEVILYEGDNPDEKDDDNG